MEKIEFNDLKAEVQMLKAFVEKLRNRVVDLEVEVRHLKLQSGEY